jgi:integrase/recombinase XerD
MAYNPDDRRGLYTKTKARRKPNNNQHAIKNTSLNHNELTIYLNRFMEWSRIKGLTEQTVIHRERSLRRFIGWCDDRSISQPVLITMPVLEAYQRHLHYHRKADGNALSLGSQHSLLAPLKAFCKWLAKEKYIAYNPAAELELPKAVRGLPKVILSREEMEQILCSINIESIYGVRDRAMLELLYSTGIRRMELINLALHDLDLNRAALLVREGKGRKDRWLPIGERALYWLKKYSLDVRDTLLMHIQEAHLFLTDYGEPWLKNRLSEMVKKYLYHAGIDKPGACHLFRHAMATHMLDNGADIRFIQAMLGHSDLSTTQIYTQVSIEKLREIHAATHPAKLIDKKLLLDQLAAESEDDGASDN